MLKKVILAVEDQTERLIWGEETERTAAVLWITDNPDRIREEYGADCCILLYLTERNRNRWWPDIPHAILSLKGLDAEYLERVYRRHIGAPWDILETERLLIREMTVEDLDDLYRIYDQPNVERWLAPLWEDREEQREILKRYIENVYPILGVGMWMMVEKKTGRCVGRVGLQLAEGDAPAEYSEIPKLGFILEKSAQRKGYCREACLAVLRYAFEEMDFGEVCAVVAEDNLASHRFCTAIGGTPRTVDGRCMYEWHRK